MQAQRAFARYGHAERPVAEHLNPHQLAPRAADIFLHNGAVYGGYLVEIEFAGEYHHIGILGEKAESGGV